MPLGEALALARAGNVGRVSLTLLAALDKRDALLEQLRRAAATLIVRGDQWRDAASTAEAEVRDLREQLRRLRIGRARLRVFVGRCADRAAAAEADRDQWRSAAEALGEQRDRALVDAVKLRNRLAELEAAR